MLVVFFSGSLYGQCNVGILTVGIGWKIGASHVAYVKHGARARPQLVYPNMGKGSENWLKIDGFPLKWVSFGGSMRVLGLNVFTLRNLAFEWNLENLKISFLDEFWLGKAFSDGIVN